MNGTVTPSVVVAVSIWSRGGGFFGSYGWNGPLLSFELMPGSAPPFRGRALRQVEELVGRRLVALLVPRAGLARPGWICGPAKTGPPIGWFDHEPRRTAATDARRERHPADPQAAHEAVQAPPPGAAERARDVPVARDEPQARGADPAGELHVDERVAAGHQVGAVREHLDPGRRQARLGRHRSQQHAGTSGKGKSRTKSASHGSALYQKALPRRAGLIPFRRPPLVAWCRQGRRRPA